MTTHKPLTLKHINQQAQGLGVEVRVTQNSTRYGELCLYAPSWHCFKFDESHAFYSGWGDGQPCASRQECYEDITERLSWRLMVCSCETCCDEASQRYDLSPGTPDELIRDYARDLGELPADA